MLLPTNIATGRVTGQFLAGVVDGVDDDQDPDAVPAAGFVTFTASVPYLPDPTAAPNPATILTTSVVAVLDNEGYLCTPSPGTLEPSYRGVRLIATDDPDISVSGWTWNATYSFSTVAGQKLAIPTHSFAVPSGGVVDLTTVVKVPSSAGIGTEQAEALAASAQAAAIQSAQDAATAAQAAVDAAAAAQVTDTGIAALVATPGSATALEVAGLVDESNAGKLGADDAVGIYQSQAALDAAAAAKVNTAGTATNTAVKAIADTAVAPKLDATVAATTYALKPDNGGKPVGKGEIVYNAKDYGVIGDNTTDDTAALNAAAAAALAAKATLYIPDGFNCKTSGTVVFRCNLRAAGATINYYGTGQAVTVGNDTGANLFTSRLTAHLPAVYNKSRGTTGWDGTSVGVRLVNLNNASRIYVTQVEDFEYGLVCYGQGGGFAYNEIFVGVLYNNHVNLRLTADATGWCNSNTFVGGRLTHVNNKGATVDDVGAIQVLLDSATGPTAAPNNNTFTGLSLEDWQGCYYRVVSNSARYNEFINCRWESASGGTPRIRWTGGDSSGSVVRGGFDAWKIVETVDPGATPGKVVPSTDPKTVNRGDETVNVKDYGALGDAVTDDTAAIQAALDAAAASFSTKRVIGAARTYVTSGVTVAAGVTLANIKLLHKAGSTLAAVRLNGAGAKLENAEVDGNVANQTVSVNGVEVNAARATVAGCYVHDTKFKGIALTASGTYAMIRGNSVVNSGASGIDVVGGSWSTVSGNTVNVTGAAGVGVSGGALGVAVTGNTIRFSTLDGVVSYESTLRELSIVGNTIESPGNHGVHVGGSGLVVANNTIKNVLVGSGVFCRNHDSTTATDVAFTGNTVRGAVMSGVRVELATGVTVSGNEASGVNDGLFVDGVTDIAVAGNTFRNTLATGARFNASQNITFVGNVLENMALDAMYLLTCGGVSISANTITTTTGGRGIRLYRTERATITGNNLKSISSDAIYGFDTAAPTTPSRYIIVTGNTINVSNGGIRSLENSNYWTVANNILVGVTGTTVGLVGANNQTGTNIVV